MRTLLLASVAMHPALVLALLTTGLSFERSLDKLAKPATSAPVSRTAALSPKNRARPGERAAWAQRHDADQRSRRRKRARPAPKSHSVTTGSWAAADAAASAASQAATAAADASARPLVPTKRVQLFIDGSWLYYAIFGGGPRCKIARKFGNDWQSSHHVDWAAIPQLISEHVEAELRMRKPGVPLAVDVTRCHVYSSLRVGQHVLERRRKMFDEMSALHFDVHLGTFSGTQEKCVDIALAVDMLHFAMVDGAYDVAVLVSGDADFVPALMRTRERGKQVAIASMRPSASASFEAAELSSLAGEQSGQIKDYDVLYFDDHLDRIITRIHPQLLRQAPAVLETLRSAIADLVAEKPSSPVTVAQVRAHLEQMALGERSALVFIEHECGSLESFLGDHLPDLELVSEDEGTDGVDNRQDDADGADSGIAVEPRWVGDSAAAAIAERRDASGEGASAFPALGDWDGDDDDDDDEWNELDEVEWEGGEDMLTAEEIAAQMGDEVVVADSSSSPTCIAVDSGDTDASAAAAPVDGGLDVAILAAESLLPGLAADDTSGSDTR